MSDTESDEIAQDPPPVDRAPRTGKRLIITWVLGSCAALVLAAAAWVLITGLLARAQLNHVTNELPQLRKALAAGDVVQARTISGDLVKRAHRAHQLTSGPAWAVGAKIPIVGTPLRTGRTIATSSDDIGHQVLPSLIDLANTLTSSSLRHGSAIDLRPIASAGRTLTTANSALTDAAERIRTAPASWVPFVGSGQRAATKSLDKLRVQVTDATRTVATLLPMLGQARPQRYFVAFENEAESRGLGGLPGAFAIIVADNGKLTFTHFENDDALRGVHVDLDLGADFYDRYHEARPTENYGDSDMSPHFPYAARIWAAMWQKKTGERIDGAIAIDPTALSYLLAVTGPATLPSGQHVTAGNVVSLTQRDQYRLFSDYRVRKKYLVDLAESVSHDILDRGGDTRRLVRAGARAAAERRLVVWSASPSVEAGLARAGYAGTVQDSGTPYVGFAVASRSSGKLDYYLDRTMTYDRTGCGASSTAVATFQMTNRAPTGLPTYVTTRLDHPRPGTTKPGDNRLLVYFFGSAGARITSITIDGKPVKLAVGRENGLVAVTADIEIPRDASRTMRVTLREPATRRAVEILKQPLVRPLLVRVTGATCD